MIYRIVHAFCNETCWKFTYCSCSNWDHFTVQHHMVVWFRGSKNRVEWASHGDCWIIVGIKISGFSHTYDCRHMKAVCDTWAVGEMYHSVSNVFTNTFGKESVDLFLLLSGCSCQRYFNLILITLRKCWLRNDYNWLSHKKVAVKEVISLPTMERAKNGNILNIYRYEIIVQV